MSEKTINKLFFFFVSIHVRMPYKETEYHLKDIQKRYDKDKTVIEDLSPMLRNAFLKYLELQNLLNND